MREAPHWSLHVGRSGPHGDEPHGSGASGPSFAACRRKRGGRPFAAARTQTFFRVARASQSTSLHAGDCAKPQQHDLLVSCTTVSPLPTPTPIIPGMVRIGSDQFSAARHIKEYGVMKLESDLKKLRKIYASNDKKKCTNLSATIELLFCVREKLEFSS